MEDNFGNLPLTKWQIKVQHFNFNLKILVKLMSMGKCVFPSDFGGVLFSQISKEGSVIYHFIYIKERNQ